MREASIRRSMVLSGQRAPDHAVARRDRPGLGASRLGSCRSGRPAAGSAPATPTGLAPRNARAGSARPEDPPAEDRGRARPRRRTHVARARVRGRALPRASDEVAARYKKSYAQRLTAEIVGDAAARRRGVARRRARRCCSRARRAHSRPRPRDVSVRHLVEPVAGAARIGAGSARRASTVCSGVTKAYVTRVGEGPFPSEIEGLRPGPPDRRRVRHGHRPRAALRLAGSRRAPLRRRERDDRARADEARRPLWI